jgi:hypothetical protein
MQTPHPKIRGEENNLRARISTSIEETKIKIAGAKESLSPLVAYPLVDEPRKKYT